MARPPGVPGTRPSGRDRALLFRQLAILLGAGMGAEGALAALAGLTEAGGDMRLAAGLLARMRQGAGLAEAMAALGGSALRGPPLAMVEAGQRAGCLAVAVSRVAAVGEHARELRQTAAAAVLMPLLLLAVWAVLLATLATARVAPATGPMGVAISAAPWSLPLLAGLGSAALVARRAADAEFRLAVDRRLLRLPGLGRLVARSESCRLLDGLARLLAAGAPLPAALAVLAVRPRNAAAAAALERVRRGLEHGHGAAALLAAEPWFPSAAAGLLAAGERDGRLAEAAACAAAGLDGWAPRLLARLASLPEPAKAAGAALLAAGSAAGLLHVS